MSTTNEKPILKIEVGKAQCCERLHWVVMAWSLTAKCWYNTGSCGIEDSLEQACSKAIQDFKVLNERLGS